MEMYVMTFFLALLSGLSHGAGVLPDNLNGALRGSVMFTTTVNQPFVLVTWTFINEGIAIVIIQSTSTEVLLTGSGYENRTTLTTSPISLELRDMTFNDSGEYKVSVSTPGGGRLDGSTNLKIHKKIAGAVITSSTVEPVKGMSINMTCEAAGNISTRDWKKDGRPLTLSSDITLHDKDRVLSFSAVKIKDSGEYLCRVSNPINFEEAKYTMTVNSFPSPLSGSVSMTVTSVLTLVGLLL